MTTINGTTSFVQVFSMWLATASAEEIGQASIELAKVTDITSVMAKAKELYFESNTNIQPVMYIKKALNLSLVDAKEHWDYFKEHIMNF